MKATRGTATPLDQAEMAIVKKYKGLLKDVPGPVSVWVTTDGGLLHFHTLIAPDDQIEAALYKVESSLLQAIDPRIVDFDVYVRPETVREFLFKDTPPLFQRD